MKNIFLSLAAALLLYSCASTHPAASAGTNEASTNNARDTRLLTDKKPEINGTQNGEVVRPAGNNNKMIQLKPVTE